MMRAEQIPTYTYVKLNLYTEKLGEESCARLQRMGVQCLNHARAYEAYAIVLDSDEMIDLLESVSEISTIEMHPPAER